MLRTHRIRAILHFLNRWQGLCALVFAMVLGSSARAANVPVLPLEEGLTIARAEIDGDVRLFAVLADDGETLRAVDLEDALKTEADAPLALLKSYDLSTIAEAVGQAQNSGGVVDVDRAMLAVPIDIAETSVAVAVNYPDHAAEVNTAAQQPFVFPKRSDAEPWNATLEIDNIVLPDYEIEVGVISDRPIKDSSDLDNARLGFVLANDGPAMIVVDLNTGLSRRVLRNHSSMQSEADAPIIIDGRETRNLGENGQPVQHRDGLNPITIDPEANWIYYGSMNGTSVWRIKTADLLNASLSEAELGQRIERYGDKPVSDGISIDNAGNVYITDLNNKAIGITKPDGSYEILVLDEDLLWCDSLSAGADGYMYVAVNQLHLSPPLNAGENESQPPYYVMRFKAPAKLVSGR